MPSDRLLPFVAVAIAFNVAPGPDIALVVRQTLAYGRRRGVQVAWGAALGSLAWGAAAVGGLVGVLTRAPGLYGTLTHAGAAYLVWLGVQSIRSGSTIPDLQSGELEESTRAGFLVGLGADLLNPKVGAFYLTLLPQFVPHDASPNWASLLIIVEVTVALIALTGLALLAARLAPLLRQPRLALLVDRGLGVTLVGLGVHAIAL